MGRIEKTVFISYRRTNFPWALAIYQDLIHHRYNVFFDFESIDSGNFEKVILENIKARAHFLIVLTPSALERCREPNDWFRREIETAMDEKRNIIPLMLEGFDFGSQPIKEALTGKLSTLNKYNGLPVYSSYFYAAMEKLRQRYLNVELGNVHLPSLNADAKAITKTQITAANKAPQVGKEELTAQEWLERGYLFAVEAKKYDEAIRCFSEAIRLDPKYAAAYNNRGTAYRDKGDPLSAIKDMTKAIRLKPDYALFYGCRGGAYAELGNSKKAIEDCTYAIQIDPTLSIAYSNRGIAYYKLDNLDKALKEFSEAIRLDPNYADAYRGRGIVRDKKGDSKGAIKDFTRAIHLMPNLSEAYYDRGVTHHQIGNLNYAIKDYTKTILLKPDFMEAYHNRGLIFEKKNDFFSAIADYQKYLDLRGEDEEVKSWIRNLKKRIKESNKPQL